MTDDWWLGVQLAELDTLFINSAATKSPAQTTRKDVDGLSSRSVEATFVSWRGCLPEEISLNNEKPYK
jgi:hypothetical protein